MPTLILKRLVFLCLTACDHIICISLGLRIRKDTRGTADVVGYKERFNVNTTMTNHFKGPQRRMQRYLDTRKLEKSVRTYMCIYVNTSVDTSTSSTGRNVEIEVRLLADTHTAYLVPGIHCIIPFRDHGLHSCGDEFM